jgi:hypothetical protein
MRTAYARYRSLALVLLCVAASLALVLLCVAPAFGQAPPPRAPNRIYDVAPDTPPAPPPSTVPPGAPVRLDYAAPAGCPEEGDLRRTVAAHMGYDPFATGPVPQAYLIRLLITPQRGGGFVAALEVRDPAGRALWVRPPLADPDCARLVSAFGSVSIRASFDTAPRAPDSPAPIVIMPPPEQPPPPPPVVPPPPSARPALRLGARAGVALGLLPAPAGAFSADLGAGWEHFSINLEGLATLPVERVVDAGVRLHSSLLAGSVVPCGHYGWFTGCALVTVGALRLEGSEGNLAVVKSGTGAYLSTGLRAALEWPIVQVLALRLSGDMLVNLHPIGAQKVREAPASSTPIEVWRSAPVAGVLGAGLVLRFGGGKAPTGAASGAASGAL